ncbi:MAG TPA: hypothetical protein VLE97_01875 [Gaiellaceae bacterium]|nr:hypothetical protein [Gaiellaceae bacterium]
MTDRLPVVIGAGNGASEIASGDTLYSNSNDIRTRPTGVNTGGGNVYARHLNAGGSAGGFHILNTSGTSDFSVMPDASPASNIVVKVNGDTIDVANWEIATGNFSLFRALFLTNAVTPTAFSTTGTTNDWAGIGFATAAVLRAATALSAVRTITGLVADAGGRLLTIHNVSATSVTGSIVLAAENGGSAAANRFAFRKDVTLFPGDSVTLWYDTTSSRWRMFGLMEFGTAATYDVPASGNASAGQVVLGSDTRLGVGNHLILPLSDDAISTKFDSSSKRVLGRKYFDPTLADWGTSGTSTITLYMLLEVTNATFVAHGDLYQETGTGSPGVVGTTSTTSSTTAALVSVDVSAAFRPGSGHAGIYTARIWVTTADGTNQATCSGAWLEIVP